MRTATQIVSREPARVLLGGVEVELHPKSYGQTTQWRSKVKDLFATAIESIQGDFDTDGGLIASIAPDFLDAPEKMFDALRAWEPGLDWVAIERDATDEEILTAFWEVAQMAYPLFKSLKASWMLETMRMLSGMSRDSTGESLSPCATVSGGTSTAAVMH